LITGIIRARLILPEKTYVYDSLSRLVEARGREHISQSNPDQSGFIEGLTLPGVRDAGGLSRYTERWLYDQIGNIQKWDHSNPAPSAPTWSRNYEYGVAGTNRLTKTSVTQGSNPTVDTIYQHDIAGNIFEFGHMTESDWNVDDQPERMVLHGNKTAHYRYDASGERFYKRMAVKNSVDEWVTQSIRLYLGGFEIYREFDVSGDVTQRRDSLHIMDDQSRVLLIETEKRDDDILVAHDPTYRWQMSDHLGSAGIELDNIGVIISYEEYHAYGTTSWHWSSGDISQKRYRYTGMERDAESGLQYHSARYYLPWVGRWLSSDPLGMVDGPGLWTYVRANPIGLNDKAGTQGGNDKYINTYEPPRRRTDRYVYPEINIEAPTYPKRENKNNLPVRQTLGLEHIDWIRVEGNDSHDGPERNPQKFWDPDMKISHSGTKQRLGEEFIQYGQWNTQRDFNSSELSTDEGEWIRNEGLVPISNPITRFDVFQPVTNLGQTTAAFGALIDAITQAANDNVVPDAIVNIGDVVETNSTETDWITSDDGFTRTKTITRDCSQTVTCTKFENEVSFSMRTQANSPTTPDANFGTKANMISTRKNTLENRINAGETSSVYRGTSYNQTALGRFGNSATLRIEQSTSTKIDVTTWSTTEVITEKFDRMREKSRSPRIRKRARKF